MQADIQTLYTSSICTVHNFLCHCQEGITSEKEYQESFSIAYIRKGNFQFKVFRNDLDAHHGLFLLNKPGYEYRVGHIHNMPDECTIFSLPADSLKLLKEQTKPLSWFFNNRDIQSILIKATPETEYLHYCILGLVLKHQFPRLKAELLMTELFIMVLSSHEKPQCSPGLNYRQKRNYLPAIESIKQFINENFTEDISLTQLAEIGCMSPFHFNRLFKKITLITPYQYLLRVRLRQAHLDLCNTSLPITEVAFSSGFNSLEHFSAMYKKIYGKTPSAVRF